MKTAKEQYRSDQELVNAVSRGDHNAFRTVLELYEPMIAKVIVGMLGNKADADDVGQDTFIRFYKSAKQYKAEASLSTYLSRIAINLSLNALKKRKNRQWISYEEKIQTQSKSEDAFEKSDTSELVAKALEYLDPAFKSVVVLRLMQGFSTKETAKILNLPLGTVLSRLSRAQNKLREIINQLEEDNLPKGRDAQLLKHQQ